MGAPNSRVLEGYGAKVVRRWAILSDIIIVAVYTVSLVQDQSLWLDGRKYRYTAVTNPLRNHAGGFRNVRNPSPV